jgi:dTDP-4-amino-4,6-dideoxygalactose transaminase
MGRIIARSRCQTHPLMPEPVIPFNRPLFLPHGLAYAREAFERYHVSGNGMFTKRCQEFFEQRLGAGKVLLTTSCTDALEMCALLLDLQPGDEVVMPAFTFVSTANAFALRGARPVFVDIRPDTLNLDEGRLEQAITPRTKAIVVVHYAGVGCAMDVICAIAARHRLPVVEDNAHGLFGSYRGQALGSFGQLSTLSFHETKNLSCGEGGALVINDPRFTARAEMLWEKGTDRGRFFRGEVDKYTWRDVGSSFLPSDILAALLWAQIEIADVIQAKRRFIFERYAANLQPWAAARGVTLPTIPDHCICSYHLFYLLLPDAAAQGALIRHLQASRINAVFHYQPLHLTPMGLKFGGRTGQCPVTELTADRLVRLPFYFDLDEPGQNRVIEAVSSFVC